MSVRHLPLATGDAFPHLDLIDASGQPASDRAGKPRVYYFMRTHTCPVCHSHIKHLARLVEQGIVDLEHITIVAPGGPQEVTAVARRHPAVADAVVASETAHEQAGLFVKAGLQQSGTFVVSADGVIVHDQVATVPLGSYNEPATIAAYQAASRALR